MNKTQKKIFRFSLVLIVIYWLYDITKLFQPTPTIPDDTTDLLLRIASIKTVTFVLLIVLLNGQGDGFKSLGWKNHKWLPQLLRGAFFGLLTFILINVLITPVLNALSPSQGTGSGIMAHFTDMSILWVWVLFAILGGGLVEEFQRVFIITRFEKWKGKKVVLLILLIDAVSFGIGHLYQGTAGAISAALTGIIFGLIYLRKRSFIEAFTAHAIYDVIGITVGHILMQQGQN